MTFPFHFRLVFALLLLGGGDALTDGVVHAHSRKFVKLGDGEFLDTAYSDGDSFRMRVGGEEHVFRLYFVDTPESDSRFPERNAEQAAYFGITPEQSVQAGKEAREFVRKTLILTPGMGCHAKAQRRKEVGLVRNPALLLRVNAEKIPTLCAFAALRLCGFA